LCLPFRQRRRRGYSAGNFEQWRTRVIVRNPATLCESCARRDRLVPVTAFTLFLLDTICGCGGGGTFTHGRRRIIILYTRCKWHAITSSKFLFSQIFKRWVQKRFPGLVSLFFELDSYHYSTTFNPPLYSGFTLLSVK
jgi:hypothetical protein